MRVRVRVRSTVRRAIAFARSLDLRHRSRPAAGIASWRTSIGRSVRHVEIDEHSKVVAAASLDEVIKAPDSNVARAVNLYEAVNGLVPQALVPPDSSVLTSTSGA